MKRFHLRYNEWCEIRIVVYHLQAPEATSFASSKTILFPGETPSRLSAYANDTPMISILSVRYELARDLRLGRIGEKGRIIPNGSGGQVLVLDRTTYRSFRLL